MSTTVTTAYVGPLAANGQAPIPFTFQSLGADEIEVRRDGEVVSAADYAVSLNEDGTGSITPLTSWGTDEVYIYSVPNYSQPTEFQRFGAWYPDQINTPLDRLARGIIALRAELNRTVRLPVGGDGLLLGETSGVVVYDNATGALVMVPQSEFRGPPGADATGDGFAFTPEQYGAVGDGVTDDGAAFAAMSAAFNLVGGGTISLRSGATYVLGGQTMSDPPLYTYYTFPPNQPYPIDIRNCTKPVVIKGNGARFETKPGARYGVFNPDGSPKAVSSGYVGVGASTPFYAVIHIQDCAAIHIENIDMDGKLDTLVTNGHFGDVGLQLAHQGLYLEDNTGPVFISNVDAHDFGMDGIHIRGPATTDTAPFENGVVVACRFECNGRQGMSFVGGKGWTFTRCAFNWTGKANVNTNTLGPVVSPPGAGIDFEAEGRVIRDVHLQDCEIIGNYGAGLLTVGDTDRITSSGTRFIGTSNYALWNATPGMKFSECLFAGTIVWPYSGGDGAANSPYDAIQFDKCDFTTSASASPIGVTYTVNGRQIEGGSKAVAARNCRFYHDLAVDGGSGNFDGIRYTDCEFWGVGTGNALYYGRFVGHNLFVGTATVPGGVLVGYNDGGPSEGSWSYRTYPAGVETKYPPTTDGAGNKLTTLTTGINADYTLNAGVDPYRFYMVGPISEPRTFTLSNTTAFIGARFRILRSADASGAFDIVIKAGAGGPTIYNLSAAEWVELEYVDGTLGWKPVAGGAL